jgi:anti-sigma-K factor RskA
LVAAQLDQPESMSRAMTQFPHPDDEDDMLAAEYVAGVLPLAERKAFEQRLAGDQSLKAKLRNWEENLSVLTDEVAPVAAPKHVLQKIESRLFANQQVPQGLVQSLMFWRGLSMASLGALAIAATLYLQQPKLIPSSTENYVAELSAPGDALKLVAFYDAQKGQIKLNRVVGTPVAGRVFELWLIAGKNLPISLGVLPVNATSTLPLNIELKSKLAGGVLAISDEPLGGSPTGQPTGAVLATGNLHLI